VPCRPQVSAHSAANDRIKPQKGVSGGLNHLACRPGSEEAQVRDVERASGLVIELSNRDLQARKLVGDVGQANHRITAAAQKRANLLQSP
jgi:hypothetical protein